MEASREIFWNIPDRSLLWIIATVVTVFFLAGFLRRVRAWCLGRKVPFPSGRLSRVSAALRAIFVQKGMTRGRVYVPMHLCIFYGMFFLFSGTLLVAAEAHLGLHFLRGAAYLAFSLLLDLAGIAVLTGIGLAVYKRYFVRPDRQESAFGDALVLALLAVVVSSGVVLKGLRLFAASDPWAAWSPAGDVIAMLAAATIDKETARHLHGPLWYGHALFSFALIALMPWTKLLHSVAVPLNYYLSLPWERRAALAAPAAGSLPVTGTVADFTRKQLIEADACVECGRCKKRCSIYQGGVGSSPASMMKNLKRLLHSNRFSRPHGASASGEGLAASVIEEGALWSCTGCRSCEDRCPMNGAHATTIVDIRRGRVDAGRVPEEVRARFAGDGKPFAVVRDRAGGLRADCDVYIWPGCHAEASQQPPTSTRLATLLERAGLTVSVLEPPACCGGPIRRLGNETLFRRDATVNIDYLKAIGNKTIVTHCPHCFNTLKNEYPGLGGDFVVMHHSQYLAGLLAEGRLPAPKRGAFKAAFHDPCFLGRYNDEISSPRKLIESVKGVQLIEMKHNGRKSFCCGSGGGTVAEGPALANGRKRVREAVKAGAGAIVTCCPYCEENLAKAALMEYPEKRVPVLDVVEILDSLPRGEKDYAPSSHEGGARRAKGRQAESGFRRNNEEKVRKGSLDRPAHPAPDAE